MLKAGITGGIGSGKSVVCQVFSTLGIPVFNADLAARFLMEHDANLVSQIKNLLGADVYAGDKLDRTKVSSLVFGNDNLLSQLNGLVHPATISYARHWQQQQSTPYIIKEAAIAFESGSYKDMDVMIGVSAPLETRIARAMKRSRLTHDQVTAIANKQMDEEEKMSRCNYVIVNDDKTALLPQILKIHSELLSRAQI